MRRRNVTFFVLVVFLCWNVMTYFFIAYRPQGKEDDDSPIDVERKIAELERDLKSQVNVHEDLLRQLNEIRDGIIQDVMERVENGRIVAKPPGDKGGGQPNQQGLESQHSQKPAAEDDPDSIVLPVLVISCNRVTVSRNLDQLLKYRPSAERFPIVVSQDCGDQKTADVIRSYGNKVTHIMHPDLSDIPLPPMQKKIFLGYYKIARHYKWAFNQMFHQMNYSALIIVEDDLDISPDFFEYFAATFRILKKDPTLWCVSAWNDNGKAAMVENDPELLYRTDFFPGLGWMLTKDTWIDLEDNWPKTFWDDWMRHPDQRKDRACIRPEVSRTSTFGKIGVSKGQFFEKHLKFIKLNDKFVPFTQKDISYLMKENYDPAYVQEVYSKPLLSLPQVLGHHKPEEKAVRVEYNDKDGFKKMAKLLGIMEDLKSGVPRAGYRGIVSFIRDGRRIYFAPPPNWNGYNTDWN